jgi:hypothetical protein
MAIEEPRDSTPAVGAFREADRFKVAVMVLVYLLDTENSWNTNGPVNVCP